MPGPSGEAPPRQSVEWGSHAAWTVADPAQAGASSTPRKPLAEGAVLVALSDGFGTWRLGDVVAIEVPQTGRAYRSSIDRVEAGLGGSRSYIGGGPVVGEGAMSLVITVGPRSAFAHVGTPEGRYEMVGNRRFGWLVPTAGMDAHVDYSKRDYFLPGERPHDADARGR